MTEASKTAANPARIHAYILLDRTGSMGPIWDEALSSVNTYAAELSKPEPGEPEPVPADVTLAVFDHHDGLKFDVLRRAVPSAGWKPVTSDEASPRGMTPLFDAIARIAALAEGDKPDKAILVIMTDGHENASAEVTREGARAALDRIRAKGWETVFLGADFAKFGDAQSVGMRNDKVMAMSAGSFETSMSRLASKSRRYFAVPDHGVEFDADDRREAGEDDVKRRKGS
ncbi:VWA domain-containing protein [Hyphomonas sp.]|uniref:VWA domain-containing protein n=1 Tax=Hyphomonas sp. TaxID=87 RepID=UPI00391BE65C